MVDLQKAFLDDRPVWYRLEDPKQLRLSDKSPFASPRGSLANEIALRKMRRNDFAVSKSFSGTNGLLELKISDLIGF